MRSPFLPGSGIARVLILATLCLALFLTGCKKEKPASKAAARKQKAPTAAAAGQPAPAPKAGEPEPAAEPEVTPSPDVAVEEAGKDMTAEVTAGEKAAAPEEAKTPSADAVPPPAVDLDRLRKVFVLLWCAEQRGASPEEVLALYHEHDYPPLENWYDIWSRAVISPGWAQSILQEARATCPRPDDGEVDPTKVLENLPVPAGAGAPKGRPEPEPTAEPAAEPTAEPAAEPAVPGK